MTLDEFLEENHPDLKVKDLDYDFMVEHALENIIVFKDSGWIKTDSGQNYSQYSKKVAENHFNVIEIIATQRIHFLEKETKEYELDPDDKLYILEFHEVKDMLLENKDAYEEELDSFGYEPVNNSIIKCKSTGEEFSKEDSNQLFAEIIAETHDPKYYETFRIKKELSDYLKSIYNILDYS